MTDALLRQDIDLNAENAEKRRKLFGAADEHRLTPMNSLFPMCVFGVTSVNYDLADLLAKAESPA
jgi:hypothetical protein